MILKARCRSETCSPPPTTKFFENLLTYQTQMESLGVSYILCGSEYLNRIETLEILRERMKCFRKIRAFLKSKS